MSTDIHSCSFYCKNPQCIRDQRDKFREILHAMPRTHIVLEVRDAEEMALQFDDLAQQTQIRSEETELYRLAQILRDKITARI